MGEIRFKFSMARNQLCECEVGHKVFTFKSRGQC